MTERAFQDKVAKLARTCGWAVVHFDTARAVADADRYETPTRYDAAGFPDLVLIHTRHPGLVWFREVKLDRSRHRLSAAQKAWRELLEQHGHNYDVWYPAIFDDIASALSGGRAVVQ